MADLTPERLQELRRIANAATPGPWRSSGFIVHSNFGAIICDVRINANALHIATFDPTTVLALLNRVEELSLACVAALRVLVAAGLFEQDEDGNITADTRFYDDLCKLANAARYVADYATDGLVAESEACLRHQFDVARAEAERLRTAARDVVRLHDEHIDPGMAGPYALAAHLEAKRKSIERLKEALKRLDAEKVIIEDDDGTP